MPREWRFGGRSAGSPRRWAAAESGLPAAAADAFVDRAAIDWRALRTRARTAADRAFVDNLRRLDRLRRPRAPTPAAVDARSGWLAAAAQLVGALAAIQTVCCLSAALFFSVRTHSVLRPSTIFLALAFASASVLLGAASRRDQRALFLLAFFASAASAFARGSVSAFQHALPPGVDLVLRGIFPEALAPAALWQFAADFPRVQRFARFDVFARRVAASVWVAGAVVFAVNVATEQIADAIVPLSLLRRNHPANVFWFAFALAITPAVIAIHVRARRAPPEERRKASRLAIALAAGTAPFLLFAIARLVMPAFNRWMLARNSLTHLAIDFVIVAALGAMPIASAIATIFDRPFDFPEWLPARWRWRAARAALVILAAVPPATLIVALYAWRGLPLAALVLMPRFWIVAAAATAGAAVIHARAAVLEALVNRSVRPADSRERLAAALERARLARGAREIAYVLARELREGIDAAAVRILECADERVGAFVDPFGQTSRLDQNAAIVAVLRRASAPIDFSDPAINALLPRVDREWLDANEIVVAMPLERRDGELAAIVACSPKRGEQPFDGRDRWFLTMMVRAVAPAWEAEAGSSNEDADADAPSESDQAADLGFECSRCGRTSATARLPCGCGAPTVLAALPPVVAGTFVVERRLGAGGMGVVYLARDATLDRPVALKTLPAPRDAAAGRLRDEARAMAALAHESLATLYGMVFWRRTPVLIVEYFPNGTLADRIAQNALAPPAALALGLRLAHALDYMHTSGVLHRDLKPSNIAYTAGGTPKLLDFGLATLIASPGRVAARVPHAKPPGTAGYLPPEAYRGAAADAAFDRWALAVVLFEAVTGKNPFASIGGRHESPIDLTPLAVVPDPLLPAVRAFFERALAHDVGARFQTTPQLVASLEAIVDLLD